MSGTDEIKAPSRWSRAMRVAWVAWVVLGLALEALALVVREDGDTLSESVWLLLERADAAPGGAFIVAALSMVFLGFLGWVSLHFLQHLIRKGRL